MSFFSINPAFDIAEEIAELIMAFIDESYDAPRDLTVYEILAQKSRPGLNPTVLANSIKSRFEGIGIPSGPLVNGYPNVMELLVDVICEEFVDALQNRMRIDLGIFPGGTINANGANAGGPVPSVGTVINAQDGIGIAR